MLKNLILGLILAHLMKIGSPNFVSEFTSASCKTLFDAIILWNLREN